MNILFLSLSMAFCWVEFTKPKISSWALEQLKFLNKKPFNCTKCMTGWIALAVGIYMYGVGGIVYLPLGVFTGAIFEAIKMRWL